MDVGFGILGGALGSLGFFGGIALIVWVTYKGEAQKRQLESGERLKALELGFPLPDAEVARAKADLARAIMAGLVGVLVPLGGAGVAAGATAMLHR